MRSATLLKLRIESSASPDGPEGFNRRLARNRALAMERYLKEKVEIPDSVLEIVSIAENWDGLRTCILADTTLPNREEMLRLIDSNLSPAIKEQRLRRLADGKPFKRLIPEILPALRYSFVRAITPFEVIEYHTNRPILHIEKEKPEYPLIFPFEMPTVPIVFPIPEEPWKRHWYLSTNLAAWALGVDNLAAEVDIAKHWTARITLTHCGWDYIKSTIKFRNLSVYPEFRWFARPNNTGFFANAHLGMAYYNFAFDGKYRYQDRDGKHPTFGGGIGIGGRWWISRDRHWLIETAIGAGVYPLDYDLFDNVPNYKEGLLMGRRKKTYWGIDQAAISITYRFGAPMKSELKQAKGGGML